MPELDTARTRGLALDVDALLDTLAAKLSDYAKRHRIERWNPVGIHTGGVWVADQLCRRMGLDAALGRLDISFYRDDFSQIGMHPQVKPSELPEDIDGAHVLLIDDVLYTGRTIRAALNEIFDYGRPASVTLAVLVDRDGRELPIQAAAAGTVIRLEVGEQIKLRGPEPLKLEIVRTDR
ncbi:MAG: bifunctional pyr operon transcriptional regulator/uracil phosphoribosyltransferase PyrR [Thioalkalivibrionaceae bacterium]